MVLDEWLDTDLQKDIWRKKYQFKNETLDDFFNRVSAGSNHIKTLMMEKKFLPAGRILAGRGLNVRGKKVTYSNCVVISPPEDNIESIFDTAKKMARCFSYGGGCGTSLENLRPKDAIVNNAAERTTGAVSFMDLYSTTTGVIGIRNRRGALILTLPVSHPDILEFIDVKKDLDKITKANISVMITDKFMHAVKNNEDWVMNFEVKDTGEVIKRTVPARLIFRKIAESSHQMAEPGVLFWDRVNNWHINSENKNFKYASVNPCFSGDMKILTTDGYKRFDELDGQEVELININGNISKGKVWYSGIRPTVEVQLSNSTKIVCTPNHEFMTVDNEIIPAVDLKGKRIKHWKRKNGVHVNEVSYTLRDEKVYDFNEPKENWGIVEGCFAKNCGEKPLPSDSNCLLGSFNLSEYVIDSFSLESRFDYSTFANDVREAVTFMNEILEEGIQYLPLEEQKQSAIKYRPLGIGVMGMADMFIKMGIKYGDLVSQTTIVEILNIMSNIALQQSALLAKEYGAYEAYDKESVLQSPYIKFVANKGTVDLIEKFGLRNCEVLSIAPTGSISTMLGVSGGIEPIYQNSYYRKTESLGNKEKHYKVFTPIVEEFMNIFDIKNEKDLPDYFVTTFDINYADRINMQSIIQMYVDSAISSTINLPNKITVEEIEDLYMYAWEKGLKGITVYRDGCERAGILSTKVSENNSKEEEKLHIESDKLMRGEVIKAPFEARSKTCKYVSGCGNAYLTVTWDENSNINQTFVNKGSTGNCKSSQEAVSRLISLSLRGGISLDDVIDQLTSVDICPAYVSARAKGKKVSKGASCPHAIGHILKKVSSELSEGDIPKIKLPSGNNVKNKINTNKENVCPECGESVIFEGGCVTCKFCGYSRCD